MKMPVTRLDPKREFDDTQRARMYSRQRKACNGCGKQFDLGNLEADHIKPHREGGKTDLRNGQLLCRKCHKAKTASGR